MAGWKLFGDGTFEGNEGHFRGDITGASGFFTGEISVGTSPNWFRVDANGNMWLGRANLAEAKVNTFATTKEGVLYAKSAIIGSWNVNTTSIYTGTEDHSGYTANAGDITIYSDGSDASIHAKQFYLDTLGVLYATGVNVSGTITATAGAIGGWTINSTSIYTGTEDHSGYTANAGDLTIYSDGADASIHAKNFYIDSTGALYCASATVSGAITTTVGSSILTDYLSGVVAQANLNVANRGWTQTCAFSITDADTVAWAAGTFTASDGTAYSIGAGTTGNMTAKTYIYLDTAVSTTAYQITTTSTTAVGVGKVLIAIAQNAVGEATYMVMQGQGGLNIDAANIVVGTVTTNEIAASTIVGANIATLAISGKTCTFDTGTVGGWTMGATELTNVSGGNTVTLSTGATAFLAGPTGAPTCTITAAGVLTATGVSISGTLTATTGTIGGFTLSSTALYTGATTTRIQLDTTSGIHLGATAFADAPFRVSLAGALVATSATVTGAITASSGSVGSFTIGTYLYTGTKTAYNDANAGVHLGSDGIGIGNNVFTVSSAGALVATSATITGSITSTSGTIGGFTLATNLLSSGTDADYVGISSDGTNAFWAGDSTFADAEFSVTSAGVLKATSATITGAITASSGSIGSFTIGTYLYTGTKTAYNDANAGVHLGSDGIGIGNNVFTVSSAGALVATSATITGSITATTGAIGGWTISSTAIYLDGATDALSSGMASADFPFYAGKKYVDRATAPFRVTPAGAVVMTSATIGNWSVNSTSIYTGTEDHSGYTANAGDITIYSDGSDASIHAKNFYIDTAGSITATSATITGTITATAGAFGSWIISGTTFTTTNNNIFVGTQAGEDITTGALNISLGHLSGINLTEGNANIFLGQQAGNGTTTGGSNVFIGATAGQGNTTASENVYIGVAAGLSSVDGTKNVYIGGGTGSSATTGSNNTFVGYYAGKLATAPGENTYIGDYAGYSNLTGYFNTCVGHIAGYSTTGNYNTFIGHGAGYTGTGSSNVFIGRSAGYYETSSNTLFIDNVARGNEADARTKALIYGIFDATTANQRLTVNGELTALNLQITSGQVLTVTTGGTLGSAAYTASTAYAAAADAYSDEKVDDRVSSLIQNGTGITWSYNDVAGTLTPTVTITQYTDELAQDAIGTILTDGTTIDFTYNDVTPSITAEVKDGTITYAKIQNVSATDKLLGRVSALAGVVEEVTCTDFAQSILDDADEATFKATVNLEIGVDVQAYNAILAAVAGGTYTGDDSIATVGTITAGVWNGTDVAVGAGGTGLGTIAAGSILAANTLDTLSAITNTSGTKYLQNASGTISWGTVTISPSFFVASDVLKASDDTEESSVGNVYLKLKEIRIPGAGGVRIKFDIKRPSGGTTGYGRIYKNGIAVGTEQTVNADVYSTKSEDLTGFVACDLIQIYVKTDNAGAQCDLRNFRIYADIVTDWTVS